MADVFPGVFAQVRTNPSRSDQTARGFVLTSPSLVRACLLGLVLSRAQPPASSVRFQGLGYKFACVLLTAHTARVMKPGGRACKLRR